MQGLTILSVSLGSSKRDKEAKTELLGVPITIRRIGADGKLYRAVEMIERFAKEVDAIGLGGIDLYLWAGKKKFVIRDALKLVRSAHDTIVADGSAVKNTLEKEQIEYLIEHHPEIPIVGSRILVVSGVDRAGMSIALSQYAKEIIFGDLMFGLGIPLQLKSYKAVTRLAYILLPILTKLPFQLLYPTGEKQEEVKPKYAKWLAWADVIAGDFHFIRRNLSKAMAGKTVITNTTTEEDRALLKERGLKWLITTTPVIDGRSFGTNVLEAGIWALMKHFGDELTETNFRIYLNKLSIKPTIFDLETSEVEGGN